MNEVVLMRTGTANLASVAAAFHRAGRSVRISESADDAADAALVVLPVALAAAHQAGLPPRSLAVAITVAASCAFLTPLEPASVLVYGPGRYRFSDFAVVGAPLTLIVLAVTLVVVPLVWG